MRVFVYDSSWMQLESCPPLNDDDGDVDHDHDNNNHNGADDQHRDHNSIELDFGMDDQDDVAVPAPPLVSANVNASDVARERQLAINMANVATLRRRLERRLDRCTRALRALEVQRDAILATVDNLYTHHITLVRAGVEQSVTQLSRYDAKFGAALASFDDDARKLRELTLHASLMQAIGNANTVRTLYDALPMSRYASSRTAASEARDKLSAISGDLLRRVAQCVTAGERVVELTNSSLPSLAELKSIVEQLRAAVAEGIKLETTLSAEYRILCDTLSGATRSSPSVTIHENLLFFTNNV